MLRANGPSLAIRLTLRLFAAAFASTADNPMPTIFFCDSLLVKAFDNVLNAPEKFAFCICAIAAGAFAALASASPVPNSTKLTPTTLDLRRLLVLLLTAIYSP